MENAIRPSVVIPRRSPDRPPASVLIDQFHPASSSHRPVTRVSISHDGQAIHLTFDVADQYVLARTDSHQGPVASDSCVEFFLQPKPGGGYFNFEVNCGGTLHCSFVRDWRNLGNGLVDRTLLTAEEIRLIKINATLPRIVWPERVEPVSWRVAVVIPFELIHGYCPGFGLSSQTHCRGNFYKCADGSSHPHWASWAPIGKALNFHNPDYFGNICLE